MALSLKVPALGESVSEATLGTWKRAEGDYVQADEPLVEVESEKATLEVGAPGAGILKRILRKAGETVAVGEVIAEIDQTARPEAAKPSSQQKKGDAPPAPAPTGGNGNGSTTNGNGAIAANANADVNVNANTGDGDGNLRAPPSARRLLAESGLPASEVKGTGRGGRISKQDVVRALQDKSQPAPSEPDASHEPQAVPAAADAEMSLTLRPDGARERVVPMSPLRRTVARRLVEAQHTAAILTTFNEVDMTNVISLRERFQERFLKQHNVKLGFMSFFVKGAIEALKTFPSVNAEIRGTDVIYKDHYDIGVAVGGGKGLVVPVVRDADRLSFAELEKTVAALAVRARDNKLTMKELEGGTFTISNGGVYGSMLSTPILNPPQSGILGLHAIQRRPMAVG
ncbi:MAG: hypothetical protein QOI66_1003, partial [Myxococcales bacterium]|nr:hypothetical protein [Myxococcales bacterium]